MASPAQNTKIELVSEAIETLVQVSVVGQLSRLQGDDARRQFDLVVQARTALADSLRTLLQPTLRVVDQDNNEENARAALVASGGHVKQI